VSITGDLDGDGVNAHSATLTISGGTFAPNNLTFTGRDDDDGDGTDEGHAVGDFDVDVTVAATTNSTEFEGSVDIDIASTKTLTAKAVAVGVGLKAVELKIGSSGGTGECDCTSMTVGVGDAAGEDAIVRLLAGTLDVNGLLTLKGTNSVNTKPQLITSSGTTLTADQLYLEGGNSTDRAAVITFNANVTVGSAGTSVTGYGQASIPSGVSLHTAGLTIGDGANIGNFEKLSGATGTVSATQIDVYGGTSLPSYLKVSAGSVVTE
jgi:hypothetical protein